MATIVPAVESSVRIIERLAADWPEPVSPRALVDELHLNRSTCYNILATLQTAGWVRSLGDRAGWTLGPKLLTLTGVTDDIALKIVHEEIDRLSRQLGFVVFVAERDGGGGYVVIDRATPRRGVRVTVGVGENFQFSTPALMFAFHAWQSPDDVERAIGRRGITSFTKLTLTDLDTIADEMQRTRERGFSTSLQQFNLAQSGVAAPIFDHEGKVSRVLCSLAFSTELNDDNVERTGRLLAECGMQITERIGGRRPDSISS